MKRAIFQTLLVLTALATPLLARADLIYYEGFNYPDGNITNTSDNVWVNFSGNGFHDMLVASQKLQVSATSSTLLGPNGETSGRADDDYRFLSLTNGSIYTNSVQLLYASFTVICTNLPNGGGSYFASFYSSSKGYCGRLMAFTNGTVLPNTWRIGVTGNTLSTNKADGGYPVDLALNTPYQVVEELDPVTLDAATVWINPLNIYQTGLSPSETRYTSSDGFGFATTTPVNAFAFRQASSFGNSFFVVTNLTTATTFAEAATNIWATNAVPPVIVRQPNAMTNFVGAPFTLSALADGQGLGNLTYQWLRNGSPYPNGNGTNTLYVSSAETTDSGNYTLVVTTPYGLSVTSSVTKVLITAQPAPPSFVAEPASQSLYSGQNVIFSTTVVTPGNPSFTWYSNNVVVTVGQSDNGNGSSLELDNVQASYAATYKVAVTNDVYPTGIISTGAVLTVKVPASVSIAYLRSLVDPVTYQATNIPPSIAYQVTGIVTTYTNLTTSDTSSYYLQDATAGINIFVTGGSTFRPQQGDVLTFTGVLSSYTSGLELYADATASSAFPYTSFTDLSNNIAGLPAPISIPYTVLDNPNNANYNLGGSFVKISDVYFGTNAGTVLSTSANTTVTVTNSAGQPFHLFFTDLDLDVAGQTLPAYASSVAGILYSANYVVTNTLVVTRFSDINTNLLPVPAPLGIGYTAGTLTFNWTNSTFVLQASTNVVGPYTTITNAASGFATNTASAPTMFFRLYHP